MPDPDNGGFALPSTLSHTRTVPVPSSDRICGRPDAPAIMSGTIILTACQGCTRVYVWLYFTPGMLMLRTLTQSLMM
jgi:hypothetical protein